MFAFAGFRYEYLSIDFMHVADLSVALYVIGPILWELFLEVGGNVTLSEEDCSILLNLIRHFAKYLGMESPINKLTIGMSKHASKPCKFKGMASECRYVLPVLL